MNAQESQKTIEILNNRILSMENDVLFWRDQANYWRELAMYNLERLKETQGKSQTIKAYKREGNVIFLS